MQWLMLQQEKPKDYVIATGEQHSVREFVERCAALLDLNLRWEGKDIDEKAVDQEGNTVVAIDPRYFRPTKWKTLWAMPPKQGRNWDGRRRHPSTSWFARWWRPT